MLCKNTPAEVFQMLFLHLFCLAKNECRHQAKEGCDHFCYPGSNSYRCSCADGYELGKDKKQCIALGRCEHGCTRGTGSVLGWAGHHLISRCHQPAWRFKWWEYYWPSKLGRKRRNLGTTTQDAKAVVKEAIFELLNMCLQRRLASSNISLTGPGFPLLCLVKSNSTEDLSV